MEKPRFVFLEPSKIGRQHITLIDGYLRALVLSADISERYQLELFASNATINELSTELIGKFNCTAIPVMNPEKRRLLRKSLLELFVVVRQAFKLKKGDILFISCILPTALWMLEKLCKYFADLNIYVVLHGELEGVFKERQESILRIGYWAKRWVHVKTHDSCIKSVVLDDFIKERLISRFPEKFSDKNVIVICHPIMPVTINTIQERKSPRICFIGYRTKNKGFADFQHTAKLLNDITFVAVGNGVVEQVPKGVVEMLEDTNAYTQAVAECDGAMFPYVDGYTCSLSAAALDALASGVRIYALDRPFFRNLGRYFGDEVVTVRGSIEELQLIMATASNAGPRSDGAWKQTLAHSKYGVESVSLSFEKLASCGRG